MMTFRLRLQKMKNQGNTRIRFSLEKLKDPNIAEFFQATIGGKFAPLLALENQDSEMDALINSFNTAVAETANNILGKHRPGKKPWVTENILKLCDTERTESRTRLMVQNFLEKPTNKLRKRHEKSKGDMD